MSGEHREHRSLLVLEGVRFGCVRFADERHQLALAGVRAVGDGFLGELACQPRRGFEHLEGGARKARRMTRRRQAIVDDVRMARGEESRFVTVEQGIGAEARAGKDMPALGREDQHDARVHESLSGSEVLPVEPGAALDVKRRQR